MKRTFLGWDGPPLVRACDVLLARGGDLSSLVVVTPGGRVGRLLLGLMVDRAGGRPISPPRFVTPGEIADVVFGPLGEVAGPVARRLAWERALARVGKLEALLPRQMGSEESRRGIAALLERCREELVGEGMRFGDVAERGALEDVEAARWRDAARVQEVYEEELRGAGLLDAGLARLKALEAGVAARPGAIALVGVPDLASVARRALMLPGVDVEAMVAAPEELAGLFDELGVIRVEAWKEREIPLREESIVFAEDHGAQAGFAFEALAKLGGKYSVSEVAIGIPDTEVGPHIERAARRCAGVVARPAEGSPLKGSRAASLLGAVRAVLEEGTFAALAALVRHPDMERYLLRRAGGDRMEKWIGPMDEFAGKRLPTAIPSASAASVEGDASVHGVIKETMRLLSPLSRARPHPNELLGVMRQIYLGNRVSRDDPGALETIRACEAIQKAVIQVASLPEEWHPESGAALIRTVLDACGDSPLPSESSADAIELLGWLELPLDPTPVAIVTGVNEGKVPESYGEDALLPDGLRARLGIACSEQRVARDTYLMTLVVRSREHVTLISGRRSPDGSPLRPSRMLFAADSKTVVDRVRRLCDKKGVAPRVRVLEGPGNENRFEVMPRVVVEPVNSMRVTAFRTYLESPYLFYLEHVLGLAEVERPDPEMDPMGFGVLIHEAMDRFGRSDARHSADERKIRECMLDHLGTVATEMIGSAPAMAVRVQLEMARQRIEEVAAWQARRRSEGWVILKTEWKPEGGVELPGMEGRFRIRGKIDRVDTTEDGSRAAILDYKTGETAEEPGKRHGKAGKWKDLQLPLYRHLARDLKLPPEGLVLGYVAVPSLPGSVDLRAAKWTDADLQDADAKAREIAARVMRGEFFDLGRKPPEEGTFAAISGTAFASQEWEEAESE